MYEPLPDPERHPVVQTLKTLTDLKSPRPGWPEATERAELAHGHEVADPDAVKKYPALVNAVLEKARTAAAMRPEEYWKQARNALAQQ